MEIEAIYQTAPIGLAIFDVDLRFQRINQQLAEINGIAIGDHIGHTLSEIVPDLANEIEPLIRRVLEKGEPVLNLDISGETSAQPGIYRTWIQNYYPTKDRTGQIVGINAVVQEITDRKQKERNSNFLAEIQNDLAMIENIGQIINIVGEKIRLWFSFSIVAFSDVDVEADEVRAIYTQGCFILNFDILCIYENAPFQASEIFVFDG